MNLLQFRLIAVFFVQTVVLISLLLVSSTGFAANPEKTNSVKTIRVVMDDNYPPYVFKGDQGELKGIIVDQWRLWEKKTGTTVELTGMAWSEAQRRMQAGEFDVIDTLFRNEKREAIYDFTKPYAQLEVPLFFHKDISGISGPEDLKGFLVAAKAGDSSIEILKKHGVTSITEYSSYEQLLEAARDGKAKVFTVDRPPALYYMNKMGIQDHFRETKPLYHGEFHRAVLKGKRDLLATVENGFSAISQSELDDLDKRWMGRHLTSTPYFRYILYGACAIAALLLLLAFWLRALRQAVAEKTVALTKKDEQFQLFMKFSPVYVYIKEVTPTGCRILQASENFEEMVGIAGSKMIGRMMAEIFPAEFAAKTDADDRAVVDRGEVLKIDEELNGRSYTTIKFPLVRGDRTLLAGYTIDITERKQAEEELRQSNITFRKLFEDSSDGILLIDATGVFVECNQAALNLLKMTREQFLFLPPASASISPEFQPDGRRSDEVALEMIELAYSKGLHRFDWTHVNAEGSKFIVEVSLLPITIKGETMLHTSWREVTERKQAEEQRLNLEKQLLHAQKLESLGVLAGGIAHDFNNLLMAIMGNAELALMRLNPESPAVDNLKRIEQTSARAADLAKQMLAYSGKGKFVVEHLDMSRLVEEMFHMLEVSISKKAVLRFNLTHPIPSVEADATQLRQIIMNLVINASEAIGDKSGVISVTTGCRECDRNYLKDVWLDENLTDGLYVYLEIADSGCGMDRETLAKLFDPFFTTKFTGRGLGMAAVLGIIRGHKGAIKVYSEPNKGTTFKVLLPASDRPAEIFDGAAHSGDWQGSGTVLLVDDEETVRGIGTEMLKELGFTVITADDGREGVLAYKQHPDIAFVILDLTMPHMDGEQCFRELRQLNPDVKVIMASGYSEQEVSEKFIGKGLAGFIQKPYTLSILRETIRKI